MFSVSKIPSSLSRYIQVKTDFMILTETNEMCKKQLKAVKTSEPLERFYAIHNNPSM